MLFALADYVQYKFQRGRYGPETLSSSGWKLATPENFRGDQRPRPTDVVIVHSRVDTLSWVVMYVTDFVGSHTTMLGSEETVIHATLDGVVEQPFATLLDGQSYILRLETSANYTSAFRRNIVD